MLVSSLMMWYNVVRLFFLTRKLKASQAFGMEMPLLHDYCWVSCIQVSDCTNDQQVTDRPWVSC